MSWAWDQLRPWLEARVSFPVGPLFCVIIGPTCGRTWSKLTGANRDAALATPFHAKRHSGGSAEQLLPCANSRSWQSA